MRLNRLLGCLVLSMSLLVCLQHAVQAQGVLVRSGFAKSFALTGDAGALTPGPARASPIGPADPRPGEINVGLAPAGGAVGVAKLHVFERSAKPVAFKATAMHGRTRLATVDMCGHLGMDSWIGLPAATSSVALSHFVETKGDCPVK